MHVPQDCGDERGSSECTDGGAPGAGARARNRPFCIGRDGFTLQAATRAGGADTAGREAFLEYILRPTVAQERIIPAKDGLVRTTPKRAFSISASRTPFFS
jgi:hypothetical protein